MRRHRRPAAPAPRLSLHASLRRYVVDLRGIYNIVDEKNTPFMIQPVTMRSRV